MVTWQPYLDPYFASIQLSSMCSIDEDIYLMRCPLICFYAVEYHLPHRVARQFGLRQEFPVEPFSTSIELHKFDRQRQKKVTDFETHHRDYIDEWNQQGDLNYENDQAHTNYNFRRYLIWYSGVTRAKIQKIRVYLQDIKDYRSNYLKVTIFFRSDGDVCVGDAS
eukprot:XP_008666778.1 serine/threonine-protein phosphatase 7 long form homolog [Zea mays]